MSNWSGDIPINGTRKSEAAGTQLLREFAQDRIGILAGSRVIGEHGKRSPRHPPACLPGISPADRRQHLNHVLTRR